MKTTIDKPGYVSAECDAPLPCPFCGGAAELKLAHATTSRLVGKKMKTVRACIFAASEPLNSGAFWFACCQCNATTGRHCDTAQGAVEFWNKRHVASSAEGQVT
ncbi:MAG: Lar family restriction alleviation protein [Planctomyces sp.]|jgi:hypothetical protein